MMKLNFVNFVKDLIVSLFSACLLPLSQTLALPALLQPQPPLANECHLIMQKYEQSWMPVSKKCRNNVHIYMSYTPTGKLLKKWTDKETLIENQYNQKDLLIFSSEGKKWFYWDYDDQGREIHTSNYTGSWTTTLYGDRYKKIKVHTGRIETYFYDDNQRETLRQFDFPSGQTSWKKTEYNSNGKIVRTDSYADNISEWYSYSYDSNGKIHIVENSKGEIWEHQYDSEGRPYRNLFEGAITKEFLYDHLGRLVREDFFFEQTGWQGTRSTRFDDQNRIVYQRDWSRLTTYQYL